MKKVEKKLEKIYKIFNDAENRLYQVLDEIRESSKKIEFKYFIDSEDNDKLKIADKYNYSGDGELFKTKQEALDFVLAEAKEKFKGYKKAKYLSRDYDETTDIHNINPPDFEIKESISFGHGITDDLYFVWFEKTGWIAEPIKEPQLMLGDEVVEIKHYYRQDNLELQSITIHCKGESVTKDEWMEWYEKVGRSIHKYVRFDLRLSKYITTWESGYPDELQIGCIENVSFKQIKAITSKLNEL